MTGKTYAESSSLQDFTVRDQNDAPIFVVAGGASAAVLDRYAGRTVIATDGVFADDGVDLTAIGGGGGGGGSGGSFFLTGSRGGVPAGSEPGQLSTAIVDSNDPPNTTTATVLNGVITIGTTGLYIVVWGINTGAVASAGAGDHVSAYVKLNDDSVGPFYYVNTRTKVLTNAQNQHYLSMGGVLEAGDTLQLNLNWELTATTGWFENFQLNGPF